MKQVFEWLWMLSWQIAAFAIVSFIIWFVLRAHSRMWRLVAERYGGEPPSTAINRKLDVAVIAARDLRMRGSLRKFRRYPGLLLDVHESGLALSLVPPFNLPCPPLFLPFEDMELEQTDWALWPEPFAIRMRDLPETDIVVGRDTVRWIGDHVQTRPFGLM